MAHTRKNIGVVIAMQTEYDAVVSRFSVDKRTIRGRPYGVATLEGKTFFFIECGVGKVNASVATMLLFEVDKMDLVVVVGSAGGIQENQNVFDVVVAKDLVYFDVDITPFGFEYGQLWGEKPRYGCDPECVELAERCLREHGATVRVGTIGTGDAFVQKDMVPELERRFGGIVCVEMEGAAVAHTCDKFGVPSLVLRMLSDVPRRADQNAVDFNANIGLVTQRLADHFRAVAERL